MNVNNGQLTKKSGSNPRRLTSHQLSLVSIILVITIYINAAFASTEESGRYHIVYAADNELCADLVTLINTDIEKYGRVQYEKHAEFVQWKNEEGIDEYRRTPNDPIPWAEVDIDNDGNVEVLYKMRGWLSSMLRESVFIERNFRENTAFREPLPPAVLNGETHKRLKSLEKIDFSGLYPLKNAPDYREYRYRDGPLVRTPSFGGSHIYLNAVNWGGSNFITVEQYDRRYEFWFIVVKYKSESDYDDICYFKFTRNP